MSQPLFLIAGFPKSGKTEFGLAMSKVTGLLSGSPSDIIYEVLAEKFRQTVVELQAINKEVLRPRLIETGNEITNFNRAELIDRLVARGVLIISGVRKKAEIAVAQDKYPGLILIWVSRPGNDIILDGTDLESSDCNYEVINDGTISALIKSANEICNDLEQKKSQQS